MDLRPLLLPKALQVLRHLAEIHLEPLEARALEGTDLPREEVVRISDALNLKAEQTTGIKNIHDVRVRQTEAGLIVNYHCVVDPQLSIVHMHDDVDAIERALRQEIPEIVRLLATPSRGPYSACVLNIVYDIPENPNLRSHGSDWRFREGSPTGHLFEIFRLSVPQGTRLRFPHW